MNRFKDFFDNLEPKETHDDFFEVVYGWTSFIVTGETAREIESQLDQSPKPRWIVFRDLNRARHRIKAKYISRVSESTVAQRAASRAFDRARRLEDKNDRRPWEDDE